MCITGCIHTQGIILNDLEKTLNTDSVELSDEDIFIELDSVKNELDQYVETLHSPYKGTNLTPYRLIGMYEYYGQKLDENNQEKLKLCLDDVSSLDKEKRGELIRKLEEIVNIMI